MKRSGLKESGLTKNSALVLMTAIVIVRGSSFLFSKQLLDSMQPLNLLGIRFLLAFLILFVVFFKRVAANIRRDPGILPASLLLGGTYFLVMAAELCGLKYTTSSTCAFIENSAIVMVPLFEALLVRKALSFNVVASTLVTFAGIGMIALRGGISSIGKGELLCMIAAVLFAWTTIITDRVCRKHDSLSVGIVYVGIMGLMGIVSSAVLETPQLPSGVSQWIMIIALALMCTCVGFTLQPVAQSRIPVETAGIMYALNPLTAGVLGWIVLDESMGVSGIIGAVLILAGILGMRKVQGG